MIAKVREASGVEFTEDIDIIDRLFLPETEINIYRMVQECVNNILKHAHATTVSVIVKKKEHSIEITVRDNGSGFDVSKNRITTERTGYGLTGLAERIKAFNGSLHIVSAPGNGSTVHISLEYVLRSEGK
jgi:signal transduction histidine kinase